MLDASGYVVARRQATVASKSIGRVNEVLIEEGQHVEAGQIVARLDDSNVKAYFTAANIATQTANIKNALLNVRQAVARKIPEDQSVSKNCKSAADSYSSGPS